MSDLDQLRTTLAQALRLAPASSPWGAPEAMHEQLEAVRRAFNRPDAIVSARSVARTLLAFRLSGRLHTFQEVKAACNGLAREADWGGRLLLEESRLLTALLQQVDAYAADGRRFRKCYRGLLANYFLYPGLSRHSTALGRDNWEKLRAFLAARRELLPQPAPLPHWATVLLAHPLLLSGDLGALYQRYGQDREFFLMVAEELGIAADSWLCDLILGPTACEEKPR